jgi:hypothetical protein
MSNWNKRYASEKSLDPNEVIKAQNAGINLGSYFSARKSATHDEAMQAHKAGANLFNYGTARESGATHDEVMQAHKSGADLYGYGYARESATHDEIMQAHKSGANLGNYGYARKSGATHDEVMQAHKAGANLFNYGTARERERDNLENMWDRESPTQEELGPYLGSKNERTHKMSNWNKRYASEFDNLHEAMEAHKSGISLGTYGYARYNGATHDEAMGS